MTITQEPRADAPPIDPRIRDRRVAVRREEGRRRLRAVLAVAGMAAAAGLAVAVTRSPLLDLDHVEVVGANHISADEIAAAGGLRPRTLLIDLNMRRAERGIERSPWVARAEVVRRWPGTVAVKVIERRPVAAVAGAEGWSLVAADGYVVATGPDQPAGVPVVAGIELPGPPGVLVKASSRPAIAVAAALTSAVRDRVATVEATAAGEVDLLLLAPKARVRLGSADRLDAKLLAVETVLAKVSTARLLVLDVRSPETPVVTRDP